MVMVEDVEVVIRMAGQVVAIDWDNTLWNNAENRLADGAHYALDRIHMAGHRVLIHSCNNPAWIRRTCEEHNLRVDYVWGETGMEAGKPVCAVYVDDRAHWFRGDWRTEIDEILKRVEDRPVMDYRGPVYRGNPKRQ